MFSEVPGQEEKGRSEKSVREDRECEKGRRETE